jgi:hypothetical protein
MIDCEQLIARLNEEAQFDHNHQTVALLRDSVKLAQDAQSAFRTLEHLGYTNHGGEYWKPPIGKAPKALAPLTFRQIAEATNEFAEIPSDKTIGIARAIEAAHGIGGTP